jgi:hypothetical protein
MRLMGLAGTRFAKADSEKPGEVLAMARPSVNFVVDSCGFVGFVLLTATGVLMRYVLPPGSGRFTTLWTLDRHGWGGIHFWLAIAFLAVLAFHLFLHWRWIATAVRGRPREGPGARVDGAVRSWASASSSSRTPAPQTTPSPKTY